MDIGDIEGKGEWENQFKATITLSEKEGHYAIPYSEFKSENGTALDLKDAVTMVFTMRSENNT